MGYIRKIILLLILSAVACDNKNINDDKHKNMETYYEEIVLGGNPRAGLLITIIAQNKSNYKQIYFRSHKSDDINECFYYDKDIRKYKIEFRKDTLTAFFLSDEQRIDLNDKVGTVFYDEYTEDISEEERLYFGHALFESQIFDTTFNNILHVKRCFHYSLLSVEAAIWPPPVKYDFYYDVDRCIFVHLEMRTLETNELIVFTHVEKVTKIDSSYFEKHQDGVVEEDSIFIPMILPFY
jgi:hypothetical protein